MKILRLNYSSVLVLIILKLFNVECYLPDFGNQGFVQNIQEALLTLQKPQTFESLNKTLPLVESVLDINAAKFLIRLKELAPILPLPVAHERYHRLQQYNVHPEITISGISGGGSFGMMISFIHSAIIKGAGIWAGAPFPTFLVLYTNPLMWFKQAGYYPIIDDLERRGLIDNTSNIASNWGAYFYWGAFDFTPKPFPFINANTFNHYGMPRERMKMLTTYPTSHCIPVDNGFYFNVFPDQDAICNARYSSSFDMFAQLYPSDFVKPEREVTPNPTGQIFKFNQSEFLPNNNALGYGLWDFAYAYVPKRCHEGIKCKLHFGFHGCSENFFSNWVGIIPKFITKVGYVAIADANDIIMIFPQARINIKVAAIGCFDLYGFTTPGTESFSTYHGPHVRMFKKMYDRIVYGW